jgi:hypothetical protein
MGEHIASIFRVEEFAEQETTMKQAGSTACRAYSLLHACFLAYSLTLMMGAVCSSVTMIDFLWTTWRYIPEDINLQVFLF